jgi:hypothetical protein
MTGLPPGPRLPALWQGIQFVTRPGRPLRRVPPAVRRDPFTVRLAVSGTVVLFSDPAAIREIFTGNEDVLPPSQGMPVVLEHRAA